MTADLVISKKKEVYLQIDCEPHVQYELRDAFEPRLIPSWGMESYCFAVPAKAE